MGLADSAQQALVVAEVGDLPTPAFPSGVVAGNIANIWSLYSDKAYAPRLLFFYAKLHAVSLLQGVVREQVNFAQAGVLQESASDKYRALSDMTKEIEARIAVMEKEARGARTAVVGRIAAAAPVVPTDPAANPYQTPTIPVDANDPRITGSPYLRPLVMTR